MQALRIQGIGFSLFATLVTLAGFVLPQPNQTMELIIMAAFIVLLGVPHGALDTVFAARLYQVQSIWGWMLFALLYFAPVLLVIAVWKLTPVLFLLGFLLISIGHFSGDPAEGTPLASRIIYAGLIIILPALLHSAEVTRLFSFLVGTAAASQIVPWLRLLGGPWLLAALVAVLACARKADWQTGMEIASVSFLSLLASPLVAFAVFFCGMHSARHILRTFEYSSRSSPRLLALASFGPMVAVLILFGAASLWLHGVSLEARVIQLVFVGLAGLTVPHMALVERVRFSGWVTPAKGSYEASLS